MGGLVLCEETACLWQLLASLGVIRFAALPAHSAEIPQVVRCRFFVFSTGISVPACPASTALASLAQERQCTFRTNPHWMAKPLLPPHQLRKPLCRQLREVASACD